MSEHLGATGEFPRGKLSQDDEGELQFALGVDGKSNTIILDFGKKVKWIGLPKEQAVELGKLLIARAEELK